ncbi:paraquat-inducible protein A [Desulfocicer vacuolatum DSM 3385]|uniref:Paraquat-inducible protein A n=2 Tax=Desulfocicer vacuolatum TaxID=2298 RepID=A0A1W2ELC0_9BACT|nr:paraquat-inducible protein A [Desulfocicer vacuolatum DSM 3385]
MISCHNCHLVCHISPLNNPSAMACPRCGSRIHRRKPNSISRTWALVITALILYIPANVLPISISTTMGNSHEDTIISGVIYFIESGSWPIGLIIFTASIFVPVLKILVLIYLLISVQKKSSRRPLDKTRLYRMVEAVGRWSMVDIFVITIIAALIKLGVLVDFKTGPAAVYFGAVVVVTIFAAMSFDPRLIWDNIKEYHE